MIVRVGIEITNSATAGVGGSSSSGDTLGVDIINVRDFPVDAIVAFSIIAPFDTVTVQDYPVDTTIGRYATTSTDTITITDYPVSLSTISGVTLPVDTITVTDYPVSFYNTITPVLKLNENSDGTFELNTILNDNSVLYNDVVMVGMGSSTMNGTGPTTASNQLRNRLDAWVTANTTNGTWFETATNGYTTNRILPDASNDATTQQHRNSTAVGSVGATVVIIALTSNDQASGVNTAQEFVDNMKLIVDDLESYGTHVFVTTTSPRTSYTAAERDVLLESRTLMFAQMDNSKIVDIMPDLSISLTGTDRAVIRPEYNSGDNTHFNDDGHQVLFDLIIAKMTEYFNGSAPYDRIELERSTQETTGFTVLNSNASLTESLSRSDSTRYYYRSRVRYNNGEYSSYSNVVDLEQPTQIGAEDQTIQINFTNSSTSDTGWNTWNPSVVTAGETLSLNNTSGASTGITAEIIEDFSGTGSSGVTSGVYPSNILTNYWTIDGNSSEDAQIRLTGLLDTNTYSVELITSRVTAQPDRWTGIEIQNRADSVYAGNNDGSEIAVLNGLVPSGGVLDIDFKAPWFGLGHLNGLVIRRYASDVFTVVLPVDTITVQDYGASTTIGRSITLSTDAVTVTDYPVGFNIDGGITVNLGTDTITVVDYPVTVEVPDAASQQLVAISTVTNSTGSNPRGYVINYPEGYNLRDDWPVIIWCHGLGRNGDGSIGELTSQLVGWTINDYCQNNDVPFVVITPQDFNGYFSGSPTRIEGIVNFLRTELASKTNEYNWHVAYNSGAGAGFAAWADDNTDNFKAMASHTPMSALSGNGTATEEQNTFDSDAGLWFHHNNVDNTVGIGAPLSYFKSVVTLAGGEDLTKYRFTRYNTTGHNAINEVYDNSGNSLAQITGDMGDGAGDYYNWTTGSWYDWLLTQEKAPATNAPTTITMSDNNVENNASIGDVVGNFSSDGNPASTYTLVSGSGDTDNARFTINGSELRTAETYSGTATYSIRVRATNSEGNTEQTFSINLITPITITDIILSADNINEDLPSGTTVATLSVAGTNNTSQVFSLANGTGDTDNNSFSINGSNLVIEIDPDFATQSTHNIRIRATESNAEYEEAVTITINEVTGGTPIMSVSLGRASMPQTTDSGWTNWNENAPVTGDAALVIGSYTLTITSDFLSTPTTTLNTPSPNNLGFPDTALQACWYERFGAEFTIAGLNDANTYNFKYVANLDPHRTDNDWGITITINGSTTSTVQPLRLGADLEVDEILNISPVSGVITVGVAGSDPFGSNRFAGLAAFILEEN